VGQGDVVERLGGGNEKVAAPISLDP